MKKKYVVAAALALFVASASAQDIYKVGLLTSTDLNGDARYVGMGGAMSALGANISAMSTNPASTAQYRRNDFSITGGVLTTSGKADDFNFFGQNKTRGSLDQAGFVYSLPLQSGSMRFVSLGFNYRKTKNFAELAALNNVRVGGLMSQTLELTQLARTTKGDTPLDLFNVQDRKNTIPLVNGAADAFLIEKQFSADSTQLVGYLPAYAAGYNYGKVQWGSNQAYDFNIAFNFSEQFYFGVNLGLYNVDYHSSMQYEEDSRNPKGDRLWSMDYPDRQLTYKLNATEDVTGTGVDAKFGFIVRPMLESPLRLGLSVTTPTFYSLESVASDQILSPYGVKKNGKPYDYGNQELTTNNSYYILSPWKANFSIGTTIANRLAVGAEYEITDHTSGQVRTPDAQEDYYDWGTGTRDKYLQTEINNYTRDTHTVRLGLEFLASRNVALRVGYNFVSAPYKKEAFLNLFTDSPSYRYAMATDYINYGATHRLALGLGVRGSNFYADAAYQYQTQGADVYAYHYNPQKKQAPANLLAGQHIDLQRSSFQVTLGYRF